MELLPFVDILKVFNNPISEEQAWAVCHQCAHFLYRNPTQEFYQDVYDSGIHSVWISRQGDVLLRKGPPEPNGSGKGPPHSPHKNHNGERERKLSNSSIMPCRSKTGVIASEIDAVKALGMAIFEALDYGIDSAEERQLSAGLEHLIATMTQTDSCLMDDDHDEFDAASQNADDEGIEKDADLDHRCSVEDVLKLCRQHLSSKQDCQHHFKAVCRALATEAGELFTFLDKISSGREKLTDTVDEDAKRLEELQRADWACLWVQVMRSLRQGVLLKKIEHVHQPPLEYELTPFEMILEDIRTRRYTLHKIMIDGDIPPKVKNDAHEVILNFIRSRPPLKKVDDRKLNPKPASPPDPHELLLQDIRAQPKLRPVREGKLLVETSRTRLNDEDDLEVMVPVKRVIKPDLNLLLNNSFDESSDEEDSLAMSTPSFSSSASSTPSPTKSTSSSVAWRRAAVKDSLTHDISSQRPSKLQRRHTIMVCESPMDGKVAPELPPLTEEEDEPSPIKESHSLASLHSGLRPNPSHTHHPSFPKTSFSDHDIQNQQVTLRHPNPTLKRRSSMEHRRSLTSLPTGLCAIPEMEDSGSNGQDGSPGSQRRPSPLVRRSWSSEQAPPPNPSPPIKARVRAGVGMSMSSIRSRPGLSSTTSTQLGKPNSESNNTGHPSQMSIGNNRMHTGESINSHSLHNSSSAQSNQSSFLPSSSSSQSDNVDSKHASSSTTANNGFNSKNNPTSPTKARHVSVASIFLNAPKSPSSSIPSSSPSSPLSSSFQTRQQERVDSTTSTPHPSISSPPNSPSSPLTPPLTGANFDIGLDSTSSSQSPSYRKHSTRNSQQSHMVIEPTPQRQSRWRQPNALEERRARRQQANIDQPSTRQSSHNTKDISTTRPISDPIPNRRLSLDSGVTQYVYGPQSQREDKPRCDMGNRRDNTATGNPTIVAPSNRRLSLGAQSQSLSSGRVKTPEDQERISRWRTLQNEDYESRLRRTRSMGGFDMPANEGGNNEILSSSMTSSVSASASLSSFSTRYQQLKQQYQSEQQKHLQNSDTPSQVTSNNQSRLEEEEEEQQPRPQQHQQPQKSFFNKNHHQHHKSRISTSGRRLIYESPEVLHQQMATEEARLAKWRQLEEGTISSIPNKDSDVNARSSPDNIMSQSDLEYVSDGHPKYLSRHHNLPSSDFSNPLNDATRAISPIDGGGTSIQTPSSSTNTTTAPQQQSQSGISHSIMPKRWENPVECLSLTLEEVTHIRSVLTKAELESLISHPDLYQMVSKSKLCFTCKTTRFSLFGEWGTKCKFCKKTVCSKCVRKMNVPADHFRNIPVYTLSPTPFSQEVLEFIQNFVKKVPNSSMPVTRTLNQSPSRNPNTTISTTTIQQPPSSSSLSSSSNSKKLQEKSSSKSVGVSFNIPSHEDNDSNTERVKFGNTAIITGTPSTTSYATKNTSASLNKSALPNKPLQRSQSSLAPGQKPLSLSTSRATVKGPLLAICCDCKGMIMEIIRASKMSLALISGSPSETDEIIGTGIGTSISLSSKSTAAVGVVEIPHPQQPTTMSSTSQPKSSVNIDGISTTNTDL